MYIYMQNIHAYFLYIFACPAPLSTNCFDSKCDTNKSIRNHVMKYGTNQYHIHPNSKHPQNFNYQSS